jgi:hypothetical protein
VLSLVFLHLALVEFNKTRGILSGQIGTETNVFIDAAHHLILLLLGLFTSLLLLPGHSATVPPQRFKLILITPRAIRARASPSCNPSQPQYRAAHQAGFFPRANGFSAREHAQRIYYGNCRASQPLPVLPDVELLNSYPASLCKLIYVSLRHANITTSHSPSVREFCQVFAHIARTAIQFSSHCFKAKMLSSRHRKNRACFGQYPDGFFNGYFLLRQ